MFTTVLNFRTGRVVDGLQKRDAIGRKKNSEIRSVTEVKNNESGFGGQLG